MSDDTMPARTDYSVREAFLKDIRIARELGQLRDTSRFWAVLEEIIEQTSQDRISQLEARIQRLEQIFETGK